MVIHPFYGPSLPENGWVPAPRYLLRRQLILDCLQEQEKCELLEIGPGAGALLYELAICGWKCSALEQSPQALKIAESLHNRPALAKFFSKPQRGWDAHFDWLMAMEVLEHIEDDTTALAQWSTWLKPGGQILLSVPAHQDKWNKTDVWAGHYRRYERDQLLQLFDKCGFTVVRIMCYGFPVGNLIEPIRARHHGRLLDKRGKASSTDEFMKQNTEQSGISRSLEKQIYPLYSNFMGVSFMKCALWLQRKFIDTDFGTGYLIHARRIN